MITLQPLETLGYNRAFFKLPVTVGCEEDFTYYLWDDNTPSRQSSYWDIVGIRRSIVPSLHFDVRLFYIDEEALDWEPFQALHDADNFLTLNPTKLHTLIQFFEEVVDTPSLLPIETSLTHFHCMEVDELHHLHCTQQEIDRGLGRFYQYTPDEQIQNRDYFSLIYVPSWSLKRDFYQGTMLEFVTFERQRLADPTFRPLDAIEWLGHMTFDQLALEEFVWLLKHHSYERFMESSGKKTFQENE